MITETYLLVADENGNESISVYTEAEMNATFTLGEQLDLEACKPVVKSVRLGCLRYINMLAAARQVAL